VTVVWLFVVVIIVWVVVIYNRLVRDRQRVLTAWSDIDVLLKRRYDLIPKLGAAGNPPLRGTRYEKGMR